MSIVFFGYLGWIRTNDFGVKVRRFTAKLQGNRKRGSVDPLLLL